MQPNFAVRNVYGDHMVFQRHHPIRIAGTAPAQSSVAVSFAGRSQVVVADDASEWRAVFPAMEAGGPHELTATCQSGASVTFRDILVGEVWLCSGQSNMEFKVLCENYYYSLRDGQAIAESANDAKLRLFNVQRSVGPDGPCGDAPAGSSWLPATTPGAVMPFSAVGYWFGVFLRRKLGDVPVGVVNASWGGTLIEPWISESSFRKAGRRRELDQVVLARDLSGDARNVHLQKLQAEFEAWLAAYFGSDPAATATALRHWAHPGLDLVGWTQGPLASLKASKTVGVAWYRREVELPAAWAGRSVTLHLDAVNDCDETFFDGVKVGATSYDTPNYWMAPRDYPVPASQVTPGRHVVAVRVINHYLQGGILGKVWLACDGEARNLDLTDGTWAERIEFAADVSKIGTRPPVPDPSQGPRLSCQTPTTLFNAMIHPFTVLNLRGFLWYQGCSNTGNPADYRVLQPLLIESWREAWDLPTAAFVLTQLSAFERHSPENRLPEDYWRAVEPHDSGYSRLREVQDGMRSHPHTGVAVTIDIGDHSDIHPHNKKDVAFRLFKQAERLCYGFTGVVEGPRYASHAIEGDRIRISFTNLGGGLVVRGGAVGEHSFAIAGSDGRFVWAQAKVEGDRILVWSPSVSRPVHVRYAWSMYPPNPNLYNAEGFPMCPFRTDTDGPRVDR